jgi:nitrous oxidase accessory protein
VDERAGIRVREAARCHIVGNTLDDTQFAIVVERTSGCEVRDNVVRGPGARQMSAGNGIHAWSSQGTTVTGNRVTGHRDGIYFEFVTGGRVRDNISEHSARYGMHFMFSDDCTYEDNTYRQNGNGVAVMYSKRVTMRGNTFAASQGSASYGLLLKDINDSEIADNRFLDNSVGLYLEDAGRNRVHGNLFRANGWALRSLASAQDNRYEANVFEQNAFDVTTNSRSSVSTFSGNYWDRYRGYDLDRNGVGDVPHLPVRLFSLIVEQSPSAVLLLRSFLVDLLDIAERAFPALTPADIRDDAPLVRRPARAAGGIS